MITYRQYRDDLTDNIRIYFGDAVNDFSGGWSLGWDIAQGYFVYHFAGGTVPQETWLWQTITFTYENLNDPDPANRTVTLDIDGSTLSTTQDQGFNETLSIRGVGIHLEGTGITSGGMPNLPLFEYDTGVALDIGFTVRGGPLVGPDGKLYYFDGEQAILVALEAVGSGPGQFRRGDTNADGSFSGLIDGLFLLNFGFVPGSPAPPCMDAADVDDGGSVNALVDGLFVLNFGFIPGSPPPPPPGPTDCGIDPTMDTVDCVDYPGCP